MIINEKMKGWHAEMSPEDSKNLAYWERNMLALFVANIMPKIVSPEFGDCGWYFHGEYPGWSRVISIDGGKITFHVDDDFDLGGLDEIAPNWDGHSTFEKWKFVMNKLGVDFDNQ